MKIVFFYEQLRDGGAERQLAQMASGLAAKNHTIHFITRWPGGQFWDEAEADKSINLSSLWARKPSRIYMRVFANLVILFQLIFTLKRLRPDVVVTALELPNLYGVIARLVNGSFLHVAGIRNTHSAKNWKLRAAETIFRPLSRYCDGVIANSETGLKSYLRAGFRYREPVVIPNGIDAARFQPDAEARMAIRRELQIPDAAVVIGHVGRFDRRKDHPAFVRALASACGMSNDIYGVMVGENVDENNALIIRLIKDHGLGDRVRLLGHRSDISGVMAGFDLLLLTSTEEGFPNAVAEAMAVGVPCIVSDCGAAARIVGKVGWVCQSRSPEEYGRHVREYLALDEAGKMRMRAEARSRIVDLFSTRNTVGLTETYLANIMATRR